MDSANYPLACSLVRAHPRANGRERERKFQRLCVMIFNLLSFITTVSLVANTYWVTDHGRPVPVRANPSVPRVVGPGAYRPSLETRANGAIDGWPERAVVRHLSLVVQAGTNDWATLNQVNGHSLKRTPSNPLCLPKNLTSKHTPL